MRRVLILLLCVSALPAIADITISTVTPAAGPVGGGTIVHLHGTNLLGVPLACVASECSVYVRFGDVAGILIFDSTGEITVIAPPHAAGSVDLVVNVPLSPPLTLKNAFTYQDAGDETVRLLLPIAAGTQGLFGSSWQTDVLAHNETTEAIEVAGTTIPPVSTRRLTLSPVSTGMFLQIPRRIFDSVTITTHVHDTTHDAESLGVDIPSIPETQFRRGIVLTGIPNDARYRALLRVYGYPGNGLLTVRIRDDQTGELLDAHLEFVVPGDPAYLQLPIAVHTASPVLRVEVTGGRQSDPPIWGFITLTNNVTESVTTITPSVSIAPEALWEPYLGGGNWAHAGNCMYVGSLNSLLVTTSQGMGELSALPLLDNDGHFEASGTFLACPFFPNQRMPARLSGLVSNGNTMAVTISTVTGTFGPFTLVHGSLEPCGPLCP